MQCQPASNLPIFLIIYLLINLNVFFFVYFCMHQKNERYILRFSVWSSKYGSAMYYLLDTAINDEHTTWWYRCCCWKTSTPIICDQICMQKEMMYFFHTSRQRFFVWMWWVEIKFQSSATSRYLTNTPAQAYMWRVI